MSKNKAYSQRLEDLFTSASPPQPDPESVPAPLPEEGDWRYAYRDVASELDRQLSRVVELGQMLSRETRLDAMLKTAVTMVADRFELYGVRIYLADADYRTLSLWASSGPQGRDLGHRRLQIPVDAHSPSGLAQSTEQSVYIPNRAESDLCTPLPLLPEAYTELALPLRTTARAFGVLDLFSRKTESFAFSRRLVLEVLASRLAAAIEEFRASQLSAPITSSRTPGETLSQRMSWGDFLDAIERKEHIGYSFIPQQSDAIEELASLLPADTPDPGVLSAPLMVSGETIGALHVERDAGLRPRPWSPDDMAFVHSIANQIAQHIENLRLLEQAERYRKEAEDAARRLTREGWESYRATSEELPEGFVYDHDLIKPLALPVSEEEPVLEEPVSLSTDIRVRDETIGQLALADLESEEDTASTILSIVAERLSTHIENLRLLEETERSRQQLDKRAAELETVARVSTAAATILTPQELLQSVVDLTKYSFNLYHAHVYLLDEDHETLILRAGAGKVGYRMVAEGERVDVLSDNRVAARCAKTRLSVLVNDLMAEPGFVPYPLLSEAVGELAVPMIVGDQILGVFDVLANTAGRFTEDDQRTYSTLATQVAVALRNAELYAEQMAIVARLRELDHLKNSFLANMSHELRTPLNSILGFAQVILEGLDGPLTEEMTTDLGLIEKNGKHLLNLINEILDMAKIEAGRLSLSPEPVNLGELLQYAIDTTSSLARDKSLYLRLENSEEADITLMLDHTRMSQVFINLIGNATKFTDSGGITLVVERQPSKVFVRIRDTGIGIPPDKLEMIFEAFSQVDTSTTRKAGGTGLGLPISRRLVEMHGGKLWAESTGIPGDGSAFIIELPLGVPGKYL